MCVIRSNTLLLWISLCMNLQPNSHNRFSKILRTLFNFRNNTHWVSLFQRNNLLIFRTGVSCFSAILFYFTLLAILEKQPANIPDRGFLFLRNTLLLYSLSPYSDRITDRGTNTLAACGLEEPFFQLCCMLSQFLVLVGNRFVLRSTIKLWCCFQLFWFWREIVFGVSYIWYLLYNTVVLLCQFLVLAGNRFWFYTLMYLEYNTIVVLCQFFGPGGKQLLTLRTYLVYNSFLFVAGNSSQNENTFLQKILLGYEIKG